MENRLTLTGQLISRNQPRRSPAGIAIARFTLEHQSEQLEAGHPRQAQFRMAAVCCGDEMVTQLEALAIGDHLLVSGFLTRASTRSGNYRLVLHTDRIEPSAALVSN